jgi:hypothetical protein
MLSSPSAGIPTPNTVAAGSKRSAASDLQRTAGLQATPSKRHATAKATAAVAGPPSMPAFGVGGMAPSPGKGVPVAAMSSLTALSNSHPPSQTPMLVTEDQLIGRTPEQLITTILQIQAHHQQYAATISAQYESVAQQLSDVKASLASLFNGQALQFQAASSVGAKLAPLEPRSPKVAMIPRSPLPLGWSLKKSLWPLSIM